MGRQAILAVISWLTLSQAAFGDNDPAKQSAIVKDNESAASAPRLYRNVPVGVYSYASAAPYASYSFHLPQFIAAPKTAASQVAPVKQKPAQNINTYLMDSYGNKFAEGPQLASYKAAFPQQFVTLQPKLPEHLAQPLVAASPNFQFKQSGPQVFFGAPFRVPALQSPAPTPLNFPNFGQHLVYADKVQSLSPNSNIQAFGAPSAQQQSTNNKAVFSSYKTEPKFQRIQEVPFGPQGEAKFQRLQGPPPSNNKNAQIQAAPAHTAVTYVDDSGKKTVVNVETEPVPLLDLTLLEPLTFDNPLVPQVQHFLPRINQATYKKLPFDTGAKQQKETPKKKQKKPTYKHSKKNDAPRKTVTQHETLDEAPEISYVISKGPGHVETVNQKSVTYNKETQSEPVHHSYGSKTENEPVTYSYSRSSKEPTTHYNQHTNSQGPSQLIYHFNPEEQARAQQVHAPRSSSENFKDSSRESEDDDSGYHRNHHTENYKKQPKSSEEHHEPEQKEQEQYLRPEKQRESSHPNPPKYYADPGHQSTSREIEPVEHEEDIQLVAKAHIKVDPTQHVQTSQEHGPPQHTQHSSPREHDERPHEQPHEHSHELSEEQSDEPPQHEERSSPQQHPHPSPSPQPHHQYSLANAPNAHVHEKSKRIIIHEEAPEGMHMLSEQMKEEVINHEENNEDEFEKAYKNAAIGFPAYSKQALEASEKDIYNPESYGIPHEHLEYNIEHTPFQQYQEEDNQYPKESRAQYKQARDKTKDDYYADYSISKPGSLIDRYQNKLGYYKLYKQQKPEYLESDDDDDNKKKQKQKFAKYTAPPTFDFPARKKQKSESYYAPSKPKQKFYEYDYLKGPRGDSTAFASQPYQRYRKTNFVEPQFQYGFEPIPIPKLIIDSELAAMASNHSPESKDPGMRKKVYKENWYIKKTSTSAGAPAS